MDRVISICIKGSIIPFLIISLTLHGQIPLAQVSSIAKNFEQEHTETIVNTNLCIAGERLYYQIFNLTDSLRVSHLSKIAYVMLQDEQDSVILKHKLWLTDGLVYGFFFIPTSLATGVYTLIGYTNASLNHPKKAVSTQDIFILNPFQKVPQRTADNRVIEISPEEISDVPKPDNSQSMGFQIETHQSSYHPREKIELTISPPQNEQGTGNFSLSVRRIPPIQLSNHDGTSKTYEASQKGLFFLPEFRGELIAGQLVARNDTTSVSYRLVALSLPGTHYIFKMARTDQYGRFFISIDQPHGAVHGVAQVIGPDRDQFLIDLYKKEITSNNKFKNRSLKLDPGIAAWLEERSVQVQIQNAYFDQNNIKSPLTAPTPAFYSDYGSEFILDDYTRFPTVRETFVEVIKLARIRRQQGKEVFEVFDPNNPYKTGPFDNLDPLVLLDGILIQDASIITQMSAFEIDRIHVIPEPYRFGPGLFRGVIDIRTIGGAPQILAPLQRFEADDSKFNRTYEFPHYENQQLDRIPDPRVQLLWKPNLHVNGTSHTEVFYASDLTGTFEIVLEGYTKSGVYMKAKHFFVVE